HVIGPEFRSGNVRAVETWTGVHHVTPGSWKELFTGSPANSALSENRNTLHISIRSCLHSCQITTCGHVPCIPGQTIRPGPKISVDKGSYFTAGQIVNLHRHLIRMRKREFNGCVRVGAARGADVKINWM